MGHGLLREPFYRQHKLPTNAYKQFSTECTKRYEPPIPYPIRDTQQSALCHIYPLSLAFAVPDTSSCVFSTRLAAKCCQCV